MDNSRVIFTFSEWLGRTLLAWNSGNLIWLRRFRMNEDIDINFLCLPIAREPWNLADVIQYEITNKYYYRNWWNHNWNPKKLGKFISSEWTSSITVNSLCLLFLHNLVNRSREHTSVRLKTLFYFVISRISIPVHNAFRHYSKSNGCCRLVWVSVSWMCSVLTS